MTPHEQEHKITYVFTLRNRHRHRRDPQLPTQILQTRELFRRRAVFEAGDVVLGQGLHVPVFLVSVLLAAVMPALRCGEVVEVVEGFGSGVGGEGAVELREVGLLGHGWWFGGFRRC